MILALCNGKNSVLDIAETIRPLVKKVDDNKTAVEIAKLHVKCILAAFLEQNADGNSVTGGYPTTSSLIKKEELSKFGKVTIREYKARDFLPKDLSEITEIPEHPLHESAPFSFTWHVTSSCSTDCRYCYLKRRDVQPLPKERILSLVDEAYEMGVMSITATGGDPLLYPHLIDFLSALSKYKFMAEMMSTKSFLSKEKAKELYECSDVIWSLQFSVDSTVQEIADYMVRTENCCKRILKSIENALNAGLRVSAKAVITPYNVLTIPKLYRDLKSLGVDVIRLATYARSGFHHSDDLFNHTESYNWLKKEIDKLKEEFPDDDIFTQNGSPIPEPPEVEISVKEKEDAWKTRSRCSAGRTTMMICADGKVIPCEQMPETEEYFCGDLSFQSIREVWDGQKLKNLTYGVPVEKFKGQPCYNCEEQEDCLHKMGLCIRDLILHRGSMYIPSDRCPKTDMPFVRQI